MLPHARDTEKGGAEGKEREREKQAEFRSCGCCVVSSPGANEYDKFLPTQFADKNQWLSQDFALEVHSPPLFAKIPPTNKWLSFSIP